MKILHVAFKGTIDGGEVLLLSLVERFKTRGHDIYVAVPSKGRLVEELNELDVLTFEFRTRKPINAIRHLVNLIDRNSIEIVHYHGRNTGIICCLAAKFSKSKPSCFSTEHGLMKRPTREAAYSTFTWVKEYSLHSAYIWMSNHLASKVICVSPSIKENRMKNGIRSEKLYTIYNGIDLPCIPESGQFDLKTRLRRTYGIPEESNVLGYVGRVDKDKNVEQLVRSIPAILHSNPMTHLTIIGEGDQVDSIKKTVFNLGIMDYVSFLGYRRNAESIMPAFDVFCFPSRSEGFGLAVAEAMAHGVPVACSNIAPLIDLTENGICAVYFEVDNIESTATSINSLLNDCSMRDRLSRNGRQRVRESFSVEAMVSHYLNLYAGIHARR